MAFRFGAAVGQHLIDVHGVCDSPRSLGLAAPTSWQIPALLRALLCTEFRCSSW